MNEIRKAFGADITIEEGERAVVAKISTRIVDRDGEVLMPMGCNTKEYEVNPVVFWNHDYAMPVGKCVAIRRADEAIYAKTIFASRPENHPEGEEWLPDTLFSLYQQGVLKAFSIGCQITEARNPTKKDMDDYGDACRRVVSKWKLFEYSAVPLPANQEAVALAVSKGLVGADTARKLFGETPPAPPPAPEPVVKAAPVPAIVVHYVRKQAAAAPLSVAKLTQLAVAKAKGRIY